MEALGSARDELQNQAVTDPLTGLYNRRYLGEFMRRELARGGRRGAPFAVIMLDLDHFKRVNDTYGHDAGDRVLTAAAELLKTQIRASDIACRYGGEEFALVLPDAGLAAAQTRAENIRAALKELRPEHRGNVLRVTASLGVAVFPEHGETMDELVAASDEALYAAKKAGRDRIATASAGPGTRQATSERMTIPFRGRRAQ
jgi:diguanylate cyclase (GGDEF)-like protein